MHYLITGGTGFVGQALCRRLLDEGHRVSVLTRDYARARTTLGRDVELLRELQELDAGEQIDVIVNLAGAPIADRRWSPRRKTELVDSRVGTTRQIIQLVQRLQHRPQCLISASAVGFYGAGDAKPLTEQSPANNEFSHELCKRWEEEARKAEAAGVRTCIIRLGIVLGRGGGMLQKLLTPFRLGLGGRLGSGSQMMSWVHRDDVVEVIRRLSEDTSLEGVFNLTAPAPVSNAEFTRALAGVLRRPAVLPLPAWFVRLVFGEMGDRLLLNGQCVMPARLQDAGYGFRYREVREALRDSV
ncbi:MAG: TIGR01777 family oxidoreductase [Pseudohongiellaceae bacterium]